MEFYFENHYDWIIHMMQTILPSKLPQEIKDSWIEYAITCNSHLLHEEVTI